MPITTTLQMKPLFLQYSLTLSSHKSGRCNNISSGSVSAAMTMNSAMPRLRHLVAAKLEFYIKHLYEVQVDYLFPSVCLLIVVLLKLVSQEKLREMSVLSKHWSQI